MKKSLILMLFVITLIFISLTPSSANTWTIDFDNGGMDVNTEKIQGIIDNNASSGDTLIFKGSSYTHTFITIDKPLNIVSTANTSISSCPSNPDKAVFTINQGGIGTNISGFRLSSSMANTTAIFINNTNNVKIENTYIISGGYGIMIENSRGVTIKSNSIINSNIALMLLSTNNSIIIDNIITNNQEGIILNGNTNYIEISRNNASKNQGNGIALLGSNSTFHRNVIISYNYINDNIDKSGIFINSSFPNINISSNMITNNGRHGICFDTGHDKTEHSLTIEYNYIMSNKGFSNFEIIRMDTKEEERIPFSIGYNFYGGNLRGFATLCSNIDTGIIVTELTKVSNGVYRLSYLRQNERTVIKEMIPHYMNVYLNDNLAMNIFVNGGTGNIDLREHNFKNSGNSINVYYRFITSIQIKDNEIPKKSIAIYSSTNLNKVKNGEMVQYTITVINNGDKKLQNIQIRELIPNFNVYSFSVTKGIFDKNNGIWTINSMNYGETTTLKISFKANKANTYKTSALLTGEGFNLKSNEISLKVEDYVNISSINKLKSNKIKKNKDTFLISTIKNTGTKNSNYITVKFQLPKGLKILGKNYQSKFDKKTKVWKLKVPSKKSIQLKMKVKGVKKGKFKVVFMVHNKKQSSYLRVY